MSPLAVGPSHLEATRRYEPQRANNFEIHIFGIPGQKDVTLAVSRGPEMKLSVGEIALPYGNREAYIAGRAQFSEGPITVRDFIEADIAGALQKWFAQVYNPATDLVGYAADYKKSAKIYEFSPDYTVSRSWELSGCWPKDISFGELSHESGGQLKLVTFTLRYDRAIPVR
jgi:hypothetical protein